MLERLDQLRCDADGRSLLGRPRVRQPLDAVRVGILRRREAAVRERQLPQHVVDRLLDHLAVARPPGDDPGVEIRGCEEGVVVQHLLEVRHEPAVVDRVAVEAAPDDVVHPPGGHAVERRRHHRERLLVAAAEQELERRGGGELRRAPEAAERGLERARDAARCFGEERRRQRLVRRRSLGGAPQSGVDPRRLALDVGSTLAPRLGHRLQQLLEARQPVSRLGREVRPRVERLRVGSHEDRGRPAARAGHADGRLHRHRVDVGTLLAIDLDVHEQLVHEGGGSGALERLVRHDVTPVARAVAHGDEQRPVLGARALERLVSPLVPVDGVLGVLEEVRARRAGEAIHGPERTRWPCPVRTTREDSAR